MQQWMADLMPVLAASDPAAATARFRDQVFAIGASYFQARAYTRPVGRLTSERHYAAGGVIERHAVPGWEGSAAFNFICFDKNPLLRPISEGRTRYRFSDYAPHRDRRFGDYWEALSEAQIGEAEQPVHHEHPVALRIKLLGDLGAAVRARQHRDRGDADGYCAGSCGAVAGGVA